MNFSDNRLMNVHWSSAGVENKIVNFIQIKHGKLHSIVIFMTSIPGTDRDHNCIIYKRSEVGPDTCQAMELHVSTWEPQSVFIWPVNRERGRKGEKDFLLCIYPGLCSQASFHCSQ